MKIYQSMTEVIGSTPMIHLNRYEKLHNIDAHIYAKVESFNPTGSAKDRIALAMIRDAEESGRLKPGGTIVEPTSGNTGIALSAVGAALGYKVIITMPDNMSLERQQLIQAYGAKLVLTPAAEDVPGAIKKAEEIVAATPGAILAGQFINEANPDIHYRTTAREIWEETMGMVDVVIAGIGTGGTITGIGKYLKEMKPEIKVIALEPEEAPMLAELRKGKHFSEIKTDPHGIQGIGDGLVPDVLDEHIYDEVVLVSTEESYKTAGEIARTEGLLMGVSSGGTLTVARMLAQRPEYKGKRIVAMCMDSGDRYLTTPAFK